jgi:aryl-alcohol dehydrogenase-like predicted oxidoreductase
MHQLRILQEKGKIQLIGLTNTDAAHLEMLIDSRFKIATNQVSCSVIDRRVICGRMSEVCKKHNVGILAYGTLLGGFMGEKWLEAPEPTNEEDLNWSLRKYLRFIKAAGGWEVFQGLLQAMSVVAKRHGVSISAVAIRHVLDIPVVSAVIVGNRLSSSSSKHLQNTLSAFSFRLDKEDRILITRAQEKLDHIPGDCGDEYRRAPFLTAKGDLSDHLSPNEEMLAVTKAVVEGKRIEYCSGGKWELIAVSLAM